MTGGTYTLVVALADPATIEVGAAGAHDFPAGSYAYTGSAFGPGGLARVDRHRELAAGERDARHWHVDYLLGHPDASVERAVTSPDLDAECEVTRAVDGERYPLGASDCSCEGHLVYDDHETLVASVERAHRVAAGRD